MRKVVSKEEMALLNAAGEMFNEMGCVPGVDGEQVLGAAFQRDGKLWTRLSRALFWPKNPRFFAANGYDPPYDNVVACVGGSYVREG